MANKIRKRRKLTERDQQVAAEILIRFAFVNSMDDFESAYKESMNDYNLCDDPFTHLPCSPGQYSENSLEYERQTMEERYGHCDGLD